MIRRFATFQGGLLTSLCLILAGVIGCHRQSASPTAIFPASNEVIGWTRTGEVRTFAAADLWKYIDGEAERYLKAGVKSASTADYKFRNQADAVVDIYTMEAAAGAEKIFESEPAGEAKSVQLGDGARLYGQQLLFRKGVHLVRVTAYSESVETQSALLALGREIEHRLGR